MGGFCSYGMQCNLISSLPTPRSTAVAITCRLSHIPVCLPVTRALSAAALELSHPTQVKLLLPATPQATRMTWQTPDVVTVVCQHAAQRKQRRWKWRARQKRNDKDSQEKFYTYQHQSISKHNVKNKPKNYRWGLWGPRSPPTANLATPLVADTNLCVLFADTQARLCVFVMQLHCWH